MKPFVDSRGPDIAPYFAHCPTATYPPRSVVFDVARAQHETLLIEHGVTRVTTCHPGGAERLLFYKGTGCVLGDTVIFGEPGNLPASARAVAITEVVVRVMSRREFERMCMSEPNLVYALLQRAHRKIANLIEQVGLAAFSDTTTQTAGLLHALWAESGRPDAPPEVNRLLHLTHQEIASATGRTRVSVSYAMKRLENAGTIALHRGWIEVLDAAGLQRAGESGLPPQTVAAAGAGRTGWASTGARGTYESSGERGGARGKESQPTRPDR